jgi:signal transduction histidine kinase
MAVVQHARGLSVPVSALAGLIALTTPLYWTVTGTIAPSWPKSFLVVAAVAILLYKPTEPDFAPIMLVLLCAELGAVWSPALSTSATAVGISVIAVSGIWRGLVGAPVYIAAVILSFLAGVTLRWYVRALYAERGTRAAVREQATMEERERIAREVHDVVGHSLSITLLHLTGARRALQLDRDVDDAIEALTEAERIGRLAMSDIRRAVGLLGKSSPRQALPGIGDIGTLVEQTRAAGLDVRYEQDGNLGSVGPSAGLGLYRIAQESLANVAKHAPDSTARFTLLVEPDTTRLTVRNRVPLGAGPPAANGSGLTNMTARATQLGAELRAGPDGEHWIVDVTVPRQPDAKESSS